MALPVFEQLARVRGSTYIRPDAPVPLEPAVPDELLRAFRRNAVHVRQALRLIERQAGPAQVDGAYLQDPGLVERYKQLSIPVRRALNPTDRAAFAQALDVLARDEACNRDQLAAITKAWTHLQTELDSLVGLGGSKVPRREILREWLEATAFYDKLERDRAYDHLMERRGKAAEGIGAQLVEDAARIILLLDEAAAAILGEPLDLPPPTRTPPPPRDPNEKWWKRLFG